MLAGDLDELERAETERDAIPLGGVARGKAKLEIADTDTSELRPIGL